METTTLESLYKLSHLYSYIPMKECVSKELCDKWYQDANPDTWMRKIMVPKRFLFQSISLRSGLTLLTIIQFTVCFLNLQILLALLGWFDSGTKTQDTPVVSPQAVELLEILFSASFQPWLTSNNAGTIKWSTFFWFGLRFFFSILAITHLLVLLRTFSVSRSLRTIQLYSIEALLCMSILIARIFFVNDIDPTYTLFHKLLYIASPLLECLFNCLMIRHLYGFQFQQGYILCRLAYEWPNHFGSKYYLFRSYIQDSAYDFGFHTFGEDPIAPYTTKTPRDLLSL